MKTANLSSALLPIVSVDMYESIISPNRVIEREADADERAMFHVYEIKDTYYDAVQDAAGQYIEEEFKDKLAKYGVKNIQPIEIHSPREYNFATDELYFDVEFDDDYFDSQEYEDNLQKIDKSEKCQKYIDDNFRSRSGFWSWMPTSVNKIRKYIGAEDFDRGVAAYLTLMLVANDELCDCFGNDVYHSSLESIYYTIEGNDFLDVKSVVSEELEDLYDDDIRVNELWLDFMKTDLYLTHYYRGDGEHYLRCRTDFAGKSNTAYDFIGWMAKNGYESEQSLREAMAA